METNEMINDYLSLMDECRNIGENVDTSNLDDDELIEHIKTKAYRRFEILLKDKKYLKDLIFDRKISDLTEDDVFELEKFANQLFDFTNSKDAGLFYTISKVLLDYAKLKNDVPMIIKESYNMGIGLYYVSITIRNIENTDAKIKSTVYFKEVCDNYFNKYELYDRNTRFYLLRCLGNRTLGMSYRTKESVETYLKYFDECMKIFNSKFYQDMNKDIPFDNLIYSKHLDKMALCSYLRKKRREDYDDFDKMVAESLYESLKYICDKEDYFEKDESRLQSWRVGQYFYAVSYHNNKCSLNSVLNYFIEQIDNIDSKNLKQSYKELIKATSYMLDYTKFMNEEEHKEYDLKISKSVEKTLKFIEEISSVNYPSLINQSLSMFTVTQLSYNQSKNILNSVIFSHRPTYVHSLMVASLSKKIAEHIIEKNPSYFIGFYNTKNKEDVLNNKRKLLSYIFKCGLYHDIGKTLVISYIATYERGLIDEEFECVKAHTKFGYQILKAMNKDDFANVALYHHKSYDELKGYPKTEQKCPNYIKPVVDIITIADSLDAATDFIGRSYKASKRYETVLNEFKEGYNTRYSGYIVDLLEDESTIKDLKHILTDTRKKIYLLVYRNKKYHLK